MTHRLPHLTRSVKIRCFTVLFFACALWSFNPLNARQNATADENNGEFNLTLCLYYSDQSQYDSAVLYGEKALIDFTQTQDTTGLIDAYHELSLIHQDIGLFDEALAYNKRALDLATVLQDTSKIIHHHKDIATIYHDYKYFSKGIENGKQGLKMANSYAPIKASERADILLSLAINHQGLGEFQEALDYHFLALQAFGNYHARFAGTHSFEDSVRLARVLNSIGGIYLDTQKPNRALPWLHRAYTLNRLLLDDYELAENLTLLGRSFITGSTPDSARYYLEQALEYARSSGSIDKLATAYSHLSAAHQALNENEKALKFASLTANLQDSVAQLKQKRAYAALDARRQVIQNQHEIEIQKNALQEQKTQLKINLLIIAGLFLFIALLVLGFVFWRYRTKQKQIAALKKQRQKLKEQQATAVINQLENERNRIARDIHDGLGQSIAALGLSIHQLYKTDTVPDIRSKNYTSCKEILDGIHTEIQSISFSLMPSKLTKAGLKEALSELAYRINEAGATQLQVHFFDIPEHISEPIQLNLFRVVQELISNTVKYANAQSVSLTLTGYENELVVMLEDDGMGFDLLKFKNSNSNGWSNISYRLSQIDANITFDTLPNRQGTTVAIEIPLISDHFRQRE